MSDNPDITQYFKDHSSPAAAASFFDQISTSENGSAMMTSVRESASSQDLFLAASPALLNDPHSNKYSGLPATLENVTESSETVSSHQEQGQGQGQDSFATAPTPTREEPVVCRIFSQENVSEDANTSSAKTFFDMLVSKSSSMDLLISSNPLTSCASSLVTSPDFTTTEGSYLTPNTPTPTGGINDEMFAKASSEADRHRDAWLPCPGTRRALVCCATSAPGACTLDRQLLTMPGVALTHELTDAVAELVTRHLGEPEASKRKVLSANDVTQDEKGLKELIQAGCYRAAVNLTGRLLTIYGQGTGKAGQQSKHTAHSVQLWFTRIALHVKLRAFALAEEEAAPFGDLDRPDLYFQYYQELYGGRMGSLAPFAFRLLLAELPQYQGDHAETLTRLHKILATVRKILKNLTDDFSEDGSPAELSPNDRAESIKLWTSRETRVLHSIVNSALYQKDYTLAIEILEMLLSTREWSSHQYRALQSALGRVYLQLGDVISAERNFNKSKELKQISNFSGDLANENDLRDLIDRGLVAVAQNAFLEGYEAFQKASVLDPSNIMLLNNMAVCLLYVGRLNEALNLLEGAINNNPNVGLHESVLLNLSILYELESSRCLQKKLSMLKLLSRYKGDGIDVSCLKLN